MAGCCCAQNDEPFPPGTILYCSHARNPTTKILKWYIKYTQISLSLSLSLYVYLYIYVFCLLFLFEFFVCLFGVLCFLTDLYLFLYPSVLCTYLFPLSAITPLNNCMNT